MLKGGGLLPSPIIIPLSSNNKIDTQSFIEIRSGWSFFFFF
jgi:hypothetical protein